MPRIILFGLIVLCFLIIWHILNTPYRQLKRYFDKYPLKSWEEGLKEKENYAKNNPFW